MKWQTLLAVYAPLVRMETHRLGGGPMRDGDDGLLYAELKLHLLNIVVVCFTCQIGDSYGDSQACQKQFSYDFRVMILPSVPLPWAALTVYPCLPEWKSNISSKVHCERCVYVHSREMSFGLSIVFQSRKICRITKAMFN
ncbi:hypothetical protein M404DRAFT_296362 [Pisolithus tinctorius Marx 270]|uniref:Uncharacterized protein n=1 Tax=Pisolithus tinctorius Marx 270 TaxID=870435 RepID=A0A0C3NKE4_PISTI|nr:hypothetical protein M404DRAFT_296362 [Pisolithus tinctorius Marx 270]